MIPCDGEMGWCEMSEHSALIYKYMVCLPLGVPVTMTDDLDSFYIQYEVGRIRTRGFDVVRRRLKSAGLYKNETEKDRCIIFRLNRRYSEKELTKMREEEEMRQAAMNSIVKVNFSDPVLYQKLIEVATRLHRICYRKMDKLSSATNGARIVEIIDKMILRYYEMTETKSSAEEKMLEWEKMRRDTQRLLIELQIVSGLKLWTKEICAKVGESVLEIRKRIDNNIKHEKVRMKEQQDKLKEIKASRLR